MPRNTIIKRLQARIDQLIVERNNAMEKSVYVPMSTEQRKEHEELCKRLLELRHELLELMRQAPKQSSAGKHSPVI